MSISVLTVSQLMTYTKSMVEDDDTLKNIYVTGEISNFYNNARSGHLYFSLKDNSCLVKCVMFSGYASQLRFV
ncbi:MAG: exodeoxyribonuclease VII large subunit, partial [Clostridia bacterium]|nr:exodeoxyribonuclease VII large subunit [Clostridia bacterium]